MVTYDHMTKLFTMKIYYDYYQTTKVEHMVQHIITVN